MLSDLPVEVLLQILFLATPRSHCYTLRGRQALVNICLTCKLWKEVIYGSPVFWTSFSLSVDNIVNLNQQSDFVNRWFLRAGDMKLSLLVEEREEVDYRDEVGVETSPLTTALEFAPAYQLFLKYSGRWERVAFDKVRFSWMHGLFMFLKQRDALEDCFREVTHFCAKATGRYDSYVLPLEHIPLLKSLGIQGRGDFQSLDFTHAGVWSNLKDLELGLYTSISKHLKIIEECVNLQKLVIRGDHIFWYWDDVGEVSRHSLLQEVREPPIALGKLHELGFRGVVYTGPFLRSLTLPNLKTLGMRKSFIPAMAEWETADDIAALLNRSKSSLEQLILTDVAITNQGLVSLLKGTPSLRRLWVEAGQSVDCRFLSELRDDLPHLDALRLTLHHANAHGPEYSRFVKDGRRWWSTEAKMEETLVKHGLARATTSRDQKCIARLENTFLQMKDSDEGGEDDDGLFCAYFRGFDKLEFAEVRENYAYTDRPSW